MVQRITKNIKIKKAITYISLQHVATYAWYLQIRIMKNKGIQYI